MSKILHKIFRFNQFNRDQWVAEQAKNIPTGATVLDAGAGTCKYKPLFAHCDYKAQDFARYSGEEHKYGELDYVCDITEIPVSGGSFDYVLCTEVFEHLPCPDLAVREFCRILRGRGTLLLTAPLNARLHMEPYHYYGGFTPHWYRKFVPEAGFEIKSIEPNKGFFSHFGQEGQYFSGLIDPRRTGQLTAINRICIFSLWLITLPLLRFLFPIAGYWLDGLGIEKTDTIGYHVIAVKGKSRKLDLNNNGKGALQI